MASGGLLIAKANASAARASGKWCEKTGARAGRLAATRRIAWAKSPAVAQLEPRTSISFSGKAPGRSGAVPEDRLTTTTRPACVTISAAWASRPASPLVSTAHGRPPPPVPSPGRPRRRPLAAAPRAGLRGEVLRRSPGHDLGTEALGQVAAAGQRVDRQHPRAGVDGGAQPGPAHRSPA